MQIAKTKFLLSSLLFIMQLLMTAQSNELSTSSWARDLSVKKDIGTVKLEKIYTELAAIDSVQRCTVIKQLTDRSNSQNARFQIRLNMLRAKFSLIALMCPDTISTFTLLENALNRAYEIEDHLLAAEANQLLGHYFTGLNELNMAATYMLIARDMRREVGEDNFQSVAINLYLLGDLLFKLGDYRESVQANDQSLKYHGQKEVNNMDSLSNYWKMNAWNSMGLGYKWLGVYDSSFIAFDHAYALSFMEGSSEFWQALIQGNRGDVFFLQGKYDSAEVLLKLDYEQSLKAKEYDNASMSLQWMARIENSRGDHQQALKMVKEADQLYRRRPSRGYRANIVYAYALVYRDLTMADSVFKYMTEYQEEKAASEKVVVQNRMDVIRLRQDNQKNVHRIQELGKEKNRIKLIRNFTIILALLITAFGILYLNRARLKLKLRQQQVIERERLAEVEVQSAKDLLGVFTQRMLEKNALVENLQEQLLRKELSDTQVQYINELSSHTILTDKDWEEFKILFEKVYPGFFINLKSKAPDITLAEQRMAALSKLRVDSKEAATLLGVSPNTISKSRQRLRQRLGLNADADLEAFFSGNEI